MKIICISASAIPSDTANSIQLMKVCQAFAQIGHEVLLLVPGNENNSGTQKDLSEHYGLTTPFKIQWLPVKNRRLFPWKAALQARRLKPDLIYAWPVQSAVLGVLLGIPSMLELHDYPHGIFGALWLRIFLLVPGRKRLLPITDALKRNLNLPGRLTVVAPDGVDLDRYLSLPDPQSARRILGLPHATTILCSGHLYQGRGTEIFLALAAAFPSESFVWVGGRPQDVETWKKHARNLPNVTFTGFVVNERIPLYQAAADVLVMPYQRKIATSSGGDTADICSPMKMFEYMAAGRAIITSDLPVLREVLDEKIAVFCPPEQLEVWKSALHALLSNSMQCQSLGRDAKHAAEKYSWLQRAKNSLDGFNA